jgi:hypothetical protein
VLVRAIISLHASHSLSTNEMDEMESRGENEKDLK